MALGDSSYTKCHTFVLGIFCFLVTDRCCVCSLSVNICLPSNLNDICLRSVSLSPTSMKTRTPWRLSAAVSSPHIVGACLSQQLTAAVVKYCRRSWCLEYERNTTSYEARGRPPHLGISASQLKTPLPVVRVATTQLNSIAFENFRWH